MTNPRPPSFGKSLFFGDLREDLLFPYPRLAPAAHRQTAELLAAQSQLLQARPELGDARLSDESAQLSTEALQAARELGLFGLAIPRAYGGLGLPLQASCRILDAVGGVDPALAVVLGVHNGLCASSILHFGSAEQRQQHLPRLASGEVIGTIQIGRGPLDIALNFGAHNGIDPCADPYISDGEAKRLGVICPSAPDLRPRPFGGAQPQLGPRAYVSTYLDSAIAVVDLDPRSPTYRRTVARIGLPSPKKVE